MSRERHGGFLENFPVGSKITTRGRTVTETDMVTFVCNYGFPEEMFIDMEYAKNKSIFQQRIAPGALTYCISEGLSLQALDRLHFIGLAFLGLEHFTVSRPLYCNDTIHVEIEVIGKRETKKVGHIVITFHHKVINQREEVIMEFDIVRLTEPDPDNNPSDMG